MELSVLCCVRSQSQVSVMELSVLCCVRSQSQLSVMELFHPSRGNSSRDDSDICSYEQVHMSTHTHTHTHTRARMS